MGDLRRAKQGKAGQSKARSSRDSVPVMKAG